MHEVTQICLRKGHLKKETESLLNNSIGSNYVKSIIYKTQSDIKYRQRERERERERDRIFKLKAENWHINFLRPGPPLPQLGRPLLQMTILFAFSTN